MSTAYSPDAANGNLRLAMAVAASALRGNDLNLFSQAAGLFQNAISLDPDSPDALLEFAVFLAHSGHFASAGTWFESALRKPPSPRAVLEYAQLLEKLERFPEALAWYSRLDGRPLEVDLRMARLERRCGNFEAARARLTALEHNANGAAEKIQLAKAATLAGAERLSEAIAVHERALGLARAGDLRGGTSAAKAGEGGLQITMVCWGEAVVQSFLEVGLPNQLSSGNIPAIAGEPGVTYRIYTSTKDIDRLLNHPALRALSSMVPVELFTFPAELVAKAESKYELANCCHQHAVLGANLLSKSLIFLSPDSIISDGCLSRLLSLKRSGVGTVLCSGPRVTKESALPELVRTASKRAIHGVQTLAVSSRDLVRVILNHPHHAMLGSYVDSGFVTDSWSCVFIEIEGTGLLARQLHLHPLMVTPQRRSVLPFGTIDTAYVGEACPDWSRIHVVEDSDSLCALSWSEHSENATMSKYPEAPWSKAQVIAHLARRHITAFNIELLQHRIRFHAEDIGPAWAAEEARSDAVVRDITQNLQARWFSRGGAEAQEPPARARTFSSAEALL